MSWWLSKQTKIHAQAKTNKGWWAANLSAVYICIYIYVQFWEWEIMERGSTAATVIASRNSLTLSLVPKKHFCMCQQKILLLPDPGGYLGQRRTPGTSRNSFASQAPKKCGFGSKHKDTKVFCSSGACGSSNAMEPVGIQLGMGWGVHMHPKRWHCQKTYTQQSFLDDGPLAQPAKGWSTPSVTKSCTASWRIAVAKFSHASK